jgi:SAM-dependent methyltransferase
MSRIHANQGIQALLNSFPNATFHGLDIATSQVKRFNEEAARLCPVGDTKTKMLAVQGDLNDPQDPFTRPEWFEFDATIISMALHHVQDPAELLKRLRQRVKPGGSIVVIDWLQKSSRDASASTDEGRMTRLSEGPKIWPGFSAEDIEKHFKAAGCSEVDVDVYSGPIDAPVEMEGYSRMFIAKGKVALCDGE